MSKLYVLVGLPGSGKSTWAEKNLIDTFRLLSSDKYREELFGDVNDQTHNDEVFKHLYIDMVYYLNNNENVCLDATNITRKSRAKIFNILKSNKVSCEKIAIIFATPIEICKERNANRDRIVPEFVIDRMIKQFELPFIGEGFDDIQIIDEPDTNYIISNEMEKMVKFNQNNPNHTLTLDRHCESCWDYVQGQLLNKVGSEILPELDFELTCLSMAARIHDIGKLYTQTYDEEKGYCHYIGHENYGAYKILTAGSINSGDGYELPHSSYRYRVAFYVNYHMMPFRLNGAKEETKQKYIKQFGDKWGNILLLHEADLNAK